jgi:Fic family protein
MPIPPRITETTYFHQLHEFLHPFDTAQHWATFVALQESPDNHNGAGKLPTLAFSTEAASVESSRIEGNSLDLNFFMRSKQRGSVAKPKQREFQEIEDLVRAYTFAQAHECSEQHFLHVHRLLSEGFLAASERGKYRTHGLMIQSAGGIEYVAIEPEFLPEAMVMLWNDIGILLQTSLSPAEAFFHAALLHLVFVHIHPFSDGNGRSVRLLEKWFLAHHLGNRAWFLPSETFYRENRGTYYANIKLGVNYYELDYRRCVPFLAMLPQSMRLFTEM